jgi:uroporphyrinogen decarboxylase
MKEEMTHRERFLAAVKNQKPDRVPACPCLSNMIPAKRTGKPFWEVYLNNDPPLWKAYLEASRYFDLDGRLIYGGISFKVSERDKAKLAVSTEIIEKNSEKWVTRTLFKTPYGDLAEETIFQVDNPPTTVAKPIKDLKQDLAAFKCLYPDPIGYDASLADAMRKEAGEDAVFCLTVGYPGFHYFTDIFDNGLEGATYAFMDYPELFEELRLVIHDNSLRRAEMMLDYRPDILYLGGSGTLTLSTPDWVRKFSLPTIKEITRMAKQAGVPTMLHSCGKARLLVDWFANETDLNCINPLELPPMGDCELKEIKQEFGKRLALSGNIHTTDVMLKGTPKMIEEACRKAIEDAGKGGGFILMTGDQCGRDTPEENIFAFVQAAKRYGTY